LCKQKNMNKYIILLLLVMATAMAISQDDNKLDALNRLLDKAEHDTVRIKIYLEMGDFYEYNLPDSAMFFYQKAINISKSAISSINIDKIKPNTPEWRLMQLFADALSYQGIMYAQKADYKLALILFHESLEINQQTNNKKGIANAYNNLGYLNYDFGNYEKAIKDFLRALEILERMEDKHGISTCLNNLGMVHSNQKSYDLSINYYLESIKISNEIGDERGVIITCNNIGIVYMTIKDYDKALMYFDIAINFLQKRKEKQGLAPCYLNKGLLLYYKAKYDSAMVYYMKSLKVAKELDEKHTIASVYAYLPILYNDMAKLAEAPETKKLYFQKAIESGIKGYDLSSEIEIISVKKIAAENLFIVYKHIGNFKKAVEYAEIVNDISSKIFSEEKAKAITEMEIKYQTEKKQLEIDNLNKANKLKIIKLEQSETLRQKQIIVIYSFIIGFVFICLIILLLIRLFIQKNKANKLLSIQNEKIILNNNVITTQKNEIEASIKYAYNIQQAVLPSKENINCLFNDSFILFIPKDIVSGDFYWAGLLSNGNFAMVTADCTGHGVPGAIMSILIITTLEKALEMEINEPSEILNFIRKTIIERLRKDGSTEGGKDGMDASLIIFNFKQSKFVYSAANNPVWVIRNGELIELPYDKMPVGKHYKDHIPFSQSEFTFISGDIIYGLTDGFPDQFGGPKGKKFMIKRFKELLVQNSSKPMHEQKQILETTFNEWKGNLEQIDDVTVIGIKV